MVVRSSATNSTTFEQLNEELNELYRYLKDNKYTDEEIKQIFQPLRSNLKRNDILKYLLGLSIFFAVFFYICMYSETIAWHLSAIGRIFLIRLLPYWDWQHLKNQQCLVNNFLPSSEALTTEIVFNCDVCENLEVIDTYENLDANTLKIKYLDLNVPIILTDSLTRWPQGSHIISNISANSELSSTVSCILASNIVNGVPNIGKLLEKTEIFDSFFLHFQICDIKPVKHFRLFVLKPKFLHAELAPIQANWVLWSRNYNTSRFKMLDLVDKIAVIGQVSGMNYLNLVPRKNCEDVCNVLQVKLEQGEFLVVTSLWNVEYKPGETGENIAVVLETH